MLSLWTISSENYSHLCLTSKSYILGNTTDKLIGDLWDYCQNTAQYKDKTAFIILTDHGRDDKFTK